MNLRVRPIVNILLQFYLALQDKMKTQRYFNTTMKTQNRVNSSIFCDLCEKKIEL